ncbi:MAG: hypothetical protein JW715_05830 [Sedimentisphaerales bacterium]|nr:hypothetical protein [Sedimentisphaerales bacterium]
MKRVIIILLSIFAANFSIAATSALPAYEQAKKLAVAAWKSAPRSIDVTYYSTIKDNTKTEEKLRQFYTELFENEYGPDEKLSPEMLKRKEEDIQINVESELAEQKQGGRKVKYRVRCDGICYRIDRVDGSPSRTVGKGAALEQFMPGKKLDANTPFERSLIETPAPTNGFVRYTYFHGLKVAEIEKMNQSPTIVKNCKISNILMMPNALILQMKLGTRRNSSAAGIFDVNQTKIKQLCSGTVEGFGVKIIPDENEPNVKDRIEFSLYSDKNIEISKSFMICAKDNYLKVYYFEATNPGADKFPLFTRTCSDFDAQGIPHNITQVQYDAEGNIRLHETYKIEDISLNMAIAKEVFEFNPPADYVVTDFRLPEAERKLAKIESIKNILKSEASVGRKSKALIDLKEYLKDDPAQLKEILTSLQNDKEPDIRRLVAALLRQIESKKQE